MAGTDTCPPLSKEVLSAAASKNTVMITFVGYEMFRIFGPTWLANVKVRAESSQKRMAPCRAAQPATASHPRISLAGAACHKCDCKHA